MSVQLDNPAGRLAAVFIDVRNSPPNQPAIDRWMEIFKVSDRLDVLRRATDLAVLVGQVEVAVRALPDDEDPEHLLRHLGEVRTMIDGLLYVGNVPMDHFIRQLTGEAIYSLETCSRALRRNGGREPTIDADGVDHLLALIRAVIDEIAASDLPVTAKVFLVERLRTVETTLLNIHLTGYAPVEAALDALTIGAVRITPEDSEARRHAGNWITRLWMALRDHAQGADAITATAAQTISAIQAITGP